ETDNKTIRTSDVETCFMVLFDLPNQRGNCLVDRGLRGIVTRSFDLRGSGCTCDRGLAVTAIDVHHYLDFGFAQLCGIITSRDLSKQTPDLTRSRLFDLDQLDADDACKITAGDVGLAAYGHAVHYCLTEFFCYVTAQHVLIDLRRIAGKEVDGDCLCLIFLAG